MWRIVFEIVLALAGIFVGYYFRGWIGTSEQYISSEEGKAVSEIGKVTKKL